MRFATVMLGVLGVGTAGAVTLAGCGPGTLIGGLGGGGTTSSHGNGGGASSSSGTASTSSSSGTTSTSSSSGITSTSSSSGTTSSGGPCAPPASCTAANKGCIGLVSNAGKTKYGLRMAEIDFTKPAALTKGIVASVLGAAVILDEPACNVHGGGTFSWLLQFDTTAGTLTTGGARPVSDPAQGYSFDTESISSFSVHPVAVNATPDGSGHFGPTPGQDVVMPAFLDPSGTQVILLPLKQLSYTTAVLSASRECIGVYNAAGLDPASSCQPDATHPEFIHGGNLTAFITLADADKVIVSSVNQSLCVILSGNAAMYGNGGSPAHCNGTFKGDWCGASNSPGGCADAVSVTATFAASSILIK